MRYHLQIWDWVAYQVRQTQTRAIGFCKWSESEEGSKVQKAEYQQRAAGQEKRTILDMQWLRASEMKRFYQCELCAKENTFDLCQGCIDQSKWCRDKFHVLSKMRLNSRGRPRPLWMVVVE